MTGPGGTAGPQRTTAPGAASGERPGTTAQAAARIATAPGTTAGSRPQAGRSPGTTPGSPSLGDAWLRDLSAEVLAAATAKAAARRGDRAEAWALLRGTLLRLAAFVAAVAAVFAWAFALVRVEGAGMAPSMGDGDLALVWRLADADEDLVADAVVVYEDEEGELHVGRIVAVAGDVVEVTEDGYLLVNGNAQEAVTLEGTYPADDADVAYPLTLAEGELWVLGDGRANAVDDDSRTVGPVGVDEVVGTVVAVLRLRGI